MSRTHSHQGVIAQCAVREYASVDDILAAAREKGEPPLIVVCDELSDPHNLGAVIRTADAAGAHGVIIPKRRSAGLTAVVAKTSAGAVSYIPVARVANIPSLLKDLKKQAEAGDRFTADILPAGAPHAEFVKATDAMNARLDALDLSEVEIGRASCRERV